jgi:hypothetical protein
VDDAVDGIGPKDLPQGILVANINLIKNRRSAGDDGDPLRHVRRSVGKIVGDDHPVPRLKKLHAGMTADISGAAGH